MIRRHVTRLLVVSAYRVREAKPGRDFGSRARDTRGNSHKNLFQRLTCFAGTIV